MKSALVVLNRQWDRGLMPWELDNHYFLTWFGFKNGNVVQLAKAAGIHRNTAIGKFQSKWGKKFTFKLRQVWREITRKFPKDKFEGRVYRFYRKRGYGPGLKRKESNALVNIWLVGFPLKALRTHYSLWALRKGWTREDVSRELGISPRTFHRIRVMGAWKGELAHKWMLPLRPSERDWYPAWKSGKRKKG